ADGQPWVRRGKRTIRSRHLPAPPAHLIDVSLLFGVWGKMVCTIQFPSPIQRSIFKSWLLFGVSCLARPGDPGLIVCGDLDRLVDVRVCPGDFYPGAEAADTCPNCIEIFFA